LKIQSSGYTGIKRLRILYLITQGILGGAQTHILHLASHLNPEFDVHVAMGVKGPLWDKLTDRGIPVYHVPSLVRNVSLVADFKGFAEIMRLLKNIKPDLISTHSSKAGILGRLAANICNVPAVFTAHGWAFTEGVSERKRRFYIGAERVAARWADKIICVSEHDRRLACNFNVGQTKQLTTIHNGMPLSTDEYLAEPRKENPGLIMVARFSEQKDHQLLLKAISDIHTDKAFKLDLVGDGPLLPRCRELVKELRLDDKVNFFGSRTDVPELLAKAQVFMLISRWEGFPRSILEAMRAGLPVIASDVGGARESVIDNETGFLIPRDDIMTLKDRLLKLINDPDLRVKMGQLGHKRFLQNFTFKQMANKTVKVYEEVLSKY